MQNFTGHNFVDTHSINLPVYYSDRPIYFYLLFPVVNILSMFLSIDDDCSRTLRNSTDADGMEGQTIEGVYSTTILLNYTLYGFLEQENKKLRSRKMYCKDIGYYQNL